jgi:glutamyl-tRNA synthetase
LLYRALGWEIPEFAHLPMMLNSKGEKLSKRHAAVSVHEYRDRGFSPMGVLNYLVRFGWSSGDQEIFRREELISLFSWDRVNKSDGKFDEKKFADVAFEHLKRDDLTSLDQYTQWVRPFLFARGLTDVPEATLRAAIPGVRERARTLVDAAQDLDFYFRENPEFDPKAREKFLSRDAAKRLMALANLLGGLEPWSASALEEAGKRFAETEKLTLKDFAQAARVALTGKAASPPLFEVMAVLGREKTLDRLRRAADLASVE